MNTNIVKLLEKYAFDNQNIHRLMSGEYFEKSIEKINKKIIQPEIKKHDGINASTLNFEIWASYMASHIYIYLLLLYLAGVGLAGADLTAWPGAPRPIGGLT